MRPRSPGFLANAVLLLPVAFAATASQGDKRFARDLAWKKLAPGASARFAFTAVADEGRGRVLLFAGETATEGQFDVLSDLWEYELATDQWRALTAKGTAPAERAYHSATFDATAGAMWVFGGATRQFEPLDDLWRLDVEKMEWKAIAPSGDRPGARFNASLHHDVAGNRLVLHGGCKAFFQDDNAWSDVWTFDIEHERWSRRTTTGPARWQAASALAPESGTLIVHGGFDGNSTVKGDTWIYSLATDEWTSAGKGFAATDAHAAVWDPLAKAMIVYGGAGAGKDGLDGLWSFDPKTKKWSELRIKGDGPGTRAYHALAWFGEQKGVWTFGGTSNQFSDPPHSNEPWLLRLH